MQTAKTGDGLVTGDYLGSWMAFPTFGKRNLKVSFGVYEFFFGCMYSCIFLY